MKAKAPEILAAMTTKSTAPSNIVRTKRNGRSTGCRTTNAQIAERVLLVAKLLCRGLFKSDIHRVVTERYHVHWRTADNYVVRARQLLLSNVQKTRDTLISESYGFYSSVLCDPNASMSDRLRAQERIDDLFALQAPRTQHHELSGPNGEPLNAPVTNVQVIIADNHRNDRPLLDAGDHVRTSPQVLEDTAPAPPAQAQHPALSPDPEQAEQETSSGVLSGADFLAS